MVTGLSGHLGLVTIVDLQQIALAKKCSPELAQTLHLVEQEQHAQEMTHKLYHVAAQ